MKKKKGKGNSTYNKLQKQSLGMDLDFIKHSSEKKHSTINECMGGSAVKNLVQEQLITRRHAETTTHSGVSSSQ